MDETAWKVLVLTARRGHIGATREDIFREIRGLAYSELEVALKDLEAEGFIAVEWTGLDRFLATITEKGGALAKEEYEKRLAAYKHRIEEQRKGGALGKL